MFGISNGLRPTQILSVRLRRPPHVPMYSRPREGPWTKKERRHLPVPAPSPSNVNPRAVVNRLARGKRGTAPPRRGGKEAETVSRSLTIEAQKTRVRGIFLAIWPEIGPGHAHPTIRSRRSVGPLR